MLTWHRIFSYFSSENLPSHSKPNLNHPTFPPLLMQSKVSTFKHVSTLFKYVSIIHLIINSNLNTMPGNKNSSSAVPSPASVKRDGGFPVWEVMIALTVLLSFGLGLVGVYLTMPNSDYSFLKLPKTLEDLQILKNHLDDYTSDYTIQVLVVYSVVYIFMQTFMIPGTVFLSLLAGSLFGVFKGVALVVFAATAGASSCYFLSKLIGKPLVLSLWPDKLNFFQTQVAKRKSGLLNYMLFLRVTPTLPNTFINFASPIVDVPYYIFFLATFIGLIPAAYVTVRAGITLGDLRSVGDLYDFQSIAIMFFIGIISVTPTLLNKNKSEAHLE